MAPTGMYCRNRAIEWQCALVMIGMSLIIVLLPIKETASLRFALAFVGIKPALLSLFVGLVAVVRIVALYLNGRLHPRGPDLRFAGAALGALTWALMGFAVVYSDAPDWDIPIYVGLLGTELYSCLRAGRDRVGAHTLK
jgi:hypothetical protein